MRNLALIIVSVVCTVFSTGCVRHFGRVLHAHGSYTHESFEDAMFELQVPMRLAVEVLENGFILDGDRLVASRPIGVYPVIGDGERRCYAALQEAMTVQRHAEALDSVAEQPDYAEIARRHGVVIPCEPVAFASVGLVEEHYVEVEVLAHTATRSVAKTRGRSADGLPHGRLTEGVHRERFASRLRVHLYRLEGERNVRVLAYAVPVAGSVEASYRGERTVDALWRPYIDGSAEHLLVRNVRRILREASTSRRTDAR